VTLPKKRTITRRPAEAASVRDLANRLNSAAIHLLRRISRDDGADGVTGARLSALSVIVYAGAGTVGELAARERLARPTVTRLVDGLEREGLVRRRPDPGDRRVVRLAATPRGRRLLERGRARRIRNLSRELAALPARDVEALLGAVDVLEQLEEVARGGQEEGR
jgi:DNA-binding MarR family transcriptional regulator